MRHPLSWGKIVILVAIICTVLLFFSYEYLLREIGHFLVFEQELQKSDVIVVLNGRDTERSLAAVDLYNDGYANLIVLARGTKCALSDCFSERVGEDFDRKIFFQRAIEAMGIPENAFKLIGHGVTSTYGEARVTREFLKENGYKSILLVTSKWHSKRAYLTFKSTFKGDESLRIVIHPSQYDSFDPDAWWKKEIHAELVFKEYVRLIYYTLTRRISPLILLSG